MSNLKHLIATIKSLPDDMAEQVLQNHLTAEYERGQSETKNPLDKDFTHIKLGDHDWHIKKFPQLDSIASEQVRASVSHSNLPPGHPGE